MNVAKPSPPARPGVTRVSFRIRAILEHRALAIDLVATLTAHVATADRDFRNAVTTAFGEAFNNVVLHGYRGRTDGMLDVDAEMTADELVLRLSDTGTAVDLAHVEPPDLDAFPESGLGVFMMKSLMDEIRYTRGSPNVLSLIKRTSPAPLATANSGTSGST